MTGEEIERVIRESQGLGVSNITFTGGEPLLRDDLERFISSVDREKSMAQVFTNGLGLTKERARSLKEAGASAVQISLDSPVPEEHDRLRAMPGLFEQVRLAVGRAREAGLLVGLSTYAGREFIDQGSLSRLAALAAEWGAVELSVFDLIPTGRLLEGENLILDKRSRARLLKESERLNQEYQGRLRVITQAWTNSGVGYAAFIGCLAACHQFHLGAYGDLTPCDFTPLSFGNIRQTSLTDLWERLTTHPRYCRRQAGCRMQDPAFRARYIHTLPREARLPFPIQDLEPEG
jgi:MoaA/NifB/PqqE/SkfB family radical SAM enzyme